MLTEYARDSVRWLRVIGLPGDSLATRRSMERKFAGVDLTPRGLSSGAIVCVRRLRAGRGRDETGDWAQVIQSRIAGMVAAGVRPFRDAVPADGPAVVFQDEAEMLACLARDWRSGTGTTWWWTGLFGSPANAELVRRVFLEHARFVPAAIELLVQSRQVIEIVRAMADGVCLELEQAVATAFGVPLLSRPEPRPIHADERNATAGWDQNVPSELLARAAAVVSLQGDAEMLSSAQRRFVSVALLVRRAPALAGTPGLVSALHRLVTFESIDSGTGSVSTAVLKPVASATVDGARAVAVESPGVDRDATRASTEAICLPLAIDSEEEAEIDAPTSSPEREGAAEEPLRSPERHGTAEEPALIEQIGEPSPEVFKTAFGGVFYLVNLAIHLGIYGDFTQPAGRNPEVPLGRFLARTAERVCGEAIREDAIWPALAILAGDGEELSALESDSPIDRAIDEIRADLEQLAARALDLPEATALEFLCVTPARVSIGRTRLDVFFALASHPIAIRVAGFDRNPGWVPAAGRVISFHYD